LLMLKFSALQDKCDFLQKMIYSFIGLVMTIVLGGVITYYINIPK
jgi:hypothetical protein